VGIWRIPMRWSGTCPASRTGAELFTVRAQPSRERRAPGRARPIQRLIGTASQVRLPFPRQKSNLGHAV
jgi:hypothetical protein